ncbi:MAG: hypothetical protein COX62_03715 [Deltaproteobacteria bacterium CG_4_10_14_0_2_um_filter_43_8]|nr:MAG: hypothetical protein COV43_05800 [Deltaproteobacteria bacterium CG11_big_fil_rev_8_21_14_0_20_42_23]PJA20991.1 MAG: hypothetical protein COX62_03715 [Deltaproteobacteria bacterium CG_4_10_14_0_2_um_filter_43_8]PJC63679.1 MAG: hypothetical protein CO021_08320 [Deltaproteobacteria bacterium CG_4_9_14_0_2_um_filter_42_21]
MTTGLPLFQVFSTALAPTPSQMKPSLLLPAIRGGVPGTAASSIYLHPTHSLAFLVLTHTRLRVPAPLREVGSATQSSPAFMVLEKAGMNDRASTHLYTEAQIAFLIQEPIDHELRVQLRDKLQTHIAAQLNDDEIHSDAFSSVQLTGVLTEVLDVFENNELAHQLSVDISEALQSDAVRKKLLAKGKQKNPAQQVACDIAAKYFQRDHRAFVELADEKKKAILSEMKTHLATQDKAFASEIEHSVERLLEGEQVHAAHMRKAVNAFLVHGFRTLSDLSSLSEIDCLSLFGFPNYHSAVLEVKKQLASLGYTLREVSEDDLEQLPLNAIIVRSLLDELQLSVSHPGGVNKYTFAALLTEYAANLKAYLEERLSDEAAPSLVIPALAGGLIENLYRQLAESESVLLQHQKQEGYDDTFEARRRELQALMKALDLTIAKAKIQHSQVITKLRQLGVSNIHDLTQVSASELQMYKKDLDRLLKAKDKSLELQLPNFSLAETEMIQFALHLVGKEFSSLYHTTFLPADLEAPAENSAQVFFEGAGLYLLPPENSDPISFDRVPLLREGSPLASLPSEALAWLTQKGSTAEVSFDRLFLSLTLLPAWTVYTPERNNTHLQVHVAKVELVDDGNAERHQTLRAVLSRIESQGFISLEEADIIRANIREPHGEERGDVIQFLLPDIRVGETQDIALRPEYQVDYTASRLSAYGLERYYDGRFGHSIWRSGLVDPAASPFHLVFLPGCGGAWSCGASGAVLIEAFAKAKASVFSLDLPYHGLSSQGESSSSMDAFMQSLFLYLSALKQEYRKPIFLMGRSYGANLVEELDWRYGDRNVIAGKIPLSGFRSEWIRYNMNDMSDLSRRGLTRLNMDGLMWSRRKAIEHGFQHFGMFSDFSQLPAHRRVSPTLYLVGDGDSSYPGANEQLWVNAANERERQGFQVGTTVIEGAGHNPFLTPTADDPEAEIKRAAASLAMKQIFGFVGKVLGNEWNGGVTRLNVANEMAAGGRKKKK